MCSSYAIDRMRVATGVVAPNAVKRSMALVTSGSTTSLSACWYCWRSYEVRALAAFFELVPDGIVGTPWQRATFMASVAICAGSSCEERASLATLCTSAGSTGL